MKKCVKVKYPTETTWRVYVVRAVDKRGVFRLGLSFVKPRTRETMEFRDTPHPERRNAEIASAVLSEIESTPWWQRPDILYVDEAPILAAIRKKRPSFELILSKSIRQKKRAQTAFQRFSMANPRYNRK